MITSIPAGTTVGFNPLAVNTCIDLSIDVMPPRPPRAICSSVAALIASTAACMLVANSAALSPRTVNRSVLFSLPVYENLDSVIYVHPFFPFVVGIFNGKLSLPMAGHWDWNEHMRHESPTDGGNHPCNTEWFIAPNT